VNILKTLIGDKEPVMVKNAEFVAFVCDETNTETMRRYVAQRMLPHSTVECGSIEQAVQYLRKMERPPAQLVVDVSDSDTPLSALAYLAEECDPSVDVYVLGAQNDVGLYRSLLQLGIRDYLVKPLTVDLLTRTLGDAQQGKAEPLQRSRTGKVISVLGVRGGIGATSLCAHLAQHLAEDQQRRVAVVDLDLYGSAISVLLGQQTNQGLMDVLQNIQGLDPQYMDRTLMKVGSRLFVLSCALDYGDSFEPQPGSLRHLVETLQHHFHYVLIDAQRLGAGMSVMTEEALDVSKLVYLVADRTVHSACAVTRMARHIGARDNEPVISILLNHTSAPSAAHVEHKDFIAATERAILLEFPYDAANLTLAQNLGERLNPRAPFAQAVVRLGNDLSGVEQKVAPMHQQWHETLRAKLKQKVS